MSFLLLFNQAEGDSSSLPSAELVLTGTAPLVTISENAVVPVRGGGSRRREPWKIEKEPLPPTKDLNVSLPSIALVLRQQPTTIELTAHSRAILGVANLSIELGAIVSRETKNKFVNVATASLELKTLGVETISDYYSFTEEEFLILLAA